MSIVKFDADKILREKTVVHCRTEEQAKNLLDWAHSIGLRWKSGASYDHFKHYYRDIAYCINEGYQCDLSYYKKVGYTILSYEDALLPEKTFPRKMLVWDSDEDRAIEATVHAIVDTLTYYQVITEESRFKYAKELPETPAEQYRNMTHAEILKWWNDQIRSGNNPALRGVNVEKRGRRISFSLKLSSTEYNQYEFTKNYTGTDADVWEEMKVRV